MIREPEFLSFVNAMLMEAVSGGSVAGAGAEESVFSNNTRINVIAFGQTTFRAALGLNARRPIRLSRTSGYCVSMATTREATMASPAKVTLVREGTDVTVIGFPVELTTLAGPVGVLLVSVAKNPTSASHAFNETSGESEIPIILKSSEYTGLQRYVVGDVTYTVVGVWEAYDAVAYSEA